MAARFATCWSAHPSWRSGWRQQESPAIRSTLRSTRRAISGPPRTSSTARSLLTRTTSRASPHDRGGFDMYPCRINHDHAVMSRRTRGGARGRGGSRPEGERGGGRGEGPADAGGGGRRTRGRRTGRARWSARWARICAVLDDVLRFLACPHCGESLRRQGEQLRCRLGHTFDVARQGYVSLLPGGGKGSSGDTAAMIRARAEFLAAGHFAHLAAALAESAAEDGRALAGDACVVDVGAGTGYYLAAILDALPGLAGVALDASRFALRRAARAHRRIGAAACDVWRGL